LGNLFLAADNRLPDTISFLWQFLRFIEIPSVFSLFVSICAIDRSLIPVQELLVLTEFSRFLLNEFDDNAPIDKLINLSALVHVCLKNPVLRDSFANEKDCFSDFPHLGLTECLVTQPDLANYRGCLE
jgi:hypothetical protein